jgi:hypothetical protein
VQITRALLMDVKNRRNSGVWSKEHQSIL